jgi:predicted ester cyclase
MSDEEVLDIAMRLPQAMSTNEWSGLREVLTEGTTMESPVFNGRGPEQIIGYFRGVKAAFPDMQGKIVTSLASGSTAVLELRSEGTHTQPLVSPRGTIPPTNKRVVLKLAFFVEASNGKVTTIREYFDPAGFMRQLGIGAPVPS